MSGTRNAVLVVMVSGLVACDNSPPQINFAQANTLCSPHQDLIINPANDYWGPRERSGDGVDPALSVHASAVEVIQNSARPKFGAAWITTARRPYFRVYDVSTGAFTAQPWDLGGMGVVSSMARMGYDAPCPAVPAETCGWFTWHSVGEANVVFAAAVGNNGVVSLRAPAAGFEPSGDSGRVAQFGNISIGLD